MKTLLELFTIISDNVRNNKDLFECIDLVLDYDGDDWREHVSFSKTNYSRNLVFKDDYIEMLIICWDVNQESGIHDHPDRGCILRVLEGVIIEDVFKMKNGVLIKDELNLCCENKISYRIGKNGLHNIINGKEKTISLHIYAPPEYKPNYFK